MEKISFFKFNNLLMERSSFDKAEISMLSQCLYKMKKKYFDAVVDNLNTGKQKNLKYKEYQIQDIVLGYHLTNSNKDYIKAVLILCNIESAKEHACFVFNPYIVE